MQKILLRFIGALRKPRLDVLSCVCIVFLCLSASIYAQEGVREAIDHALEFQRNENGYQAHRIPGYNISVAKSRIVPERVCTFKGTDGADIKHTISEHEIYDYQIAQGFDYEKHGKIMQYQQGCVGTVIGDMWFYGKNEGWELIHKDDQGQTPQTFEQGFDTAGRHWQDGIGYCIEKNNFPRFIYHRPSRKLLYTTASQLPNRDHPYEHTNLVIEQEGKQEVLREKNGRFISHIALDKSGRYCAYGIRYSNLLPKEEGKDYTTYDSYTCVKIVDLDGNDSGVLNDILKTKEFHLTETKNHQQTHAVSFTHLNFLDDGCVEVRTVGPEYEAYAWRITPEGVKVKHECMLDVGNNQLAPLGKVYNPFPILYEKLSQSQPNLRCYDQRLLWMIHFFNNFSGSEKSNFFNFDIKKLLLSTWWMHDEKLRENTVFVYGKNEEVLPAKDKAAFNILCASHQKAIKSNDPDTLFYAAARGKEWGTSAYRKSEWAASSKKILEHLFKQCSLPQAQVINLGDNSIVVDSNGLVAFNHYITYKDPEKVKNVSYVRQPFFRRYYDHVHCDQWSLQHAQEFINETAFLSHQLEQVDENIKTLTMRYNDGSGDVVYEEQYDANEPMRNLLSDWKRPMDYKSLPGDYQMHYYPHGSLTAKKEEASFLMKEATNYLWYSPLMCDIWSCKRWISRVFTWSFWSWVKF